MTKLTGLFILFLSSGIEGAFSSSGAKTVIPKKVIGKFSIRIVPNQEPEEVIRLTKTYLEEYHKQRGSPNHLRLLSFHSLFFFSQCTVTATLFLILVLILLEVLREEEYIIIKKYHT